jgi:benzoyl-CoA reductase/2-hydroxyglutaryl-CoA dehydratase subunit BcrC/BadD/HgdB
VLIINKEFCEAQNFNYPIFRNALEEAGIRCLRLETGIQTQASGHVVVFEADMCDDRYFNEQVIKTKLDHFFEQMYRED